MKSESKQIDVTNITPSDTNPRTTFEESKILELSESLKSVGLINPITIKPDEKGRFKIVAGERRWKAAVILGWKTISCIVRNVSEEEALEIQIIENSQREDVSPMDEARAFKSLIKKENLDWLASKIHKTKKYIMDRLKLNDLCDEVAYLLLMGKLPLGHCIVLSKLNEEEQKLSLDFLMANYALWEPNEIEHAHCIKTLDVFKEYIEDKYMLEFDKACFNLKDENLYPEAGSCAVCPKRTTNAMLLFEDITSEDRCTDNKCFNIKVANHIANAIATAKQKHEKVYTGEFSLYLNSDKVKANSLELKYVEKFKTGLTAVVITKTDNWRRKSLGKIVFVEMPDAAAIKQEKAVKRNAVSSGISYQERHNMRLKDIVYPRINAISKYINGKNLNAKIYPDLIKNYFLDELTSKQYYTLVLAGILGVSDKIKDADDAVKKQHEYLEYQEFAAIREKVLEIIPEESLPIIFMLLETCDEDEDDEKDEESLKPTWKELVDILKIKS